MDSSEMSPTLDDIKAARERIVHHIEKTPLISCRSINDACGRKIFMKAENFQKSGSFKVRGAFNAVLSALEKDGVKSLVTHSSGNHGVALAKVGRVLNIPVTVVMPKTAPPFKRKSATSFGAEVIECEPTHAERERKCEEVQRNTEAMFVSSSQDLRVIAGQGTVALEMLEKQPDLDAIVVPVGGGGLLSGVATAAKAIKPSIQIYGAEPEIANSCYKSLRSGQRTTLQEYPNTIADGLRTNIGSITWPIIKQKVDDLILVTEDEIASAMALIWERAKIVVEPSSAVALAAVKSHSKAKGLAGISKVGVVLTGGNVGFSNIF
uniref:probable serine racemase n=1 Tax=Ciona intestinalis TaxID=7719 RepID=UPI000180C4E2|nr:probable serine racemase [Ciona intestinalis]|eukprot:XP_002124202.3 probable serine racemase [Ciona intestinalis]